MYSAYNIYLILLVILSFLFLEFQAFDSITENHDVASLNIKLNDNVYFSKDIVKRNDMNSILIENNEINDQQKREVKKKKKVSKNKKKSKKSSIKKPPTKKPLKKTTSTKKPIIKKTSTTKISNKKLTTEKHTTKMPTTKITTRRKASDKKTKIPKPTTKITTSPTTVKPDKYAELKSKIINDINKEREKYHAKPLIFNATIAKNAQERAEYLARPGVIPMYDHESPYGELYYDVATGDEINPLKRWTIEANRVEFDNLKNFNIQYEITLLIWKSSTDIGCGITDVSYGILVICRIYPKGNIFGEFDKNVEKP